MTEKAYYGLFLASKKYDLFAKIFKLLGFDIAIVDSDEEVPNKLGQILEERRDYYALVVMPEDYVESTHSIRASLRDSGAILPLFLFLPDMSNPKFKQISELNETLRRVLGLDIESLIAK